MPEDKGTAPEPTTPETGAEPGGDAPADEDDTTALRAEVADLKDRLVRTLAEMENLRKRTEREMADTRQYAVASFARDMLTVSDNLKRAIAAVPRELRENGDKALLSLIEGVEVTERGLEQTLTKFGVRSIDAKGEKFNPDIHQAMYEVETAEVPAGSVAEVMQTGYVIGERVLRPALVAVAKPPAKPVPTPANDDRESVSAERGAGDSPEPA
jgi:molecular chaperone GrpE